MLYRLLADLTVIIHLLFIVFVMLGGIAVFWRKWVAWLHIPAAVWGAYIEFTGHICPLTPLEQCFRTLAGEQGYQESFIEHYLLPIIYPAGLTPQIQVMLAIFVIGINLTVYLFVAYRWLNKRKHGLC